MRNAKFTPEALSHLAEWAKYEPKALKRVFRILDECCRTPFERLGKPEPLRGNFKGYWSRRIDAEHRIIYEVSEDNITIFSLRGHYD